MIASVLHLVVAVLLAGLTFAAGRAWSRDRRPYTPIVVAVGLALTYDNAVLGLGRWIGHGSLLEGLSTPRFVLHALLTPLLVIVGFGAARGFGLSWARGRLAHAAACTVSVALVAWGVVTDVVRLELEARSEGGIVSYGNGAASAPVPAIATIVALVVIGALVWRAAGWPWLAVGAGAMFVASALGGISGLITNAGELSLIASLVATEHAAARRPIRRQEAPPVRRDLAVRYASASRPMP